MKNFDIRPASERDTTAIAHIAADTELFPPDMLDGMMAPYVGQESQDIWFVGEVGSQVVAFGFCEPERMTDGTWNLLAIGVQPDHQGKGLGRRMMSYIERRLAIMGQRILIVETMGTPDFSDTRRFYKQNGYSEEARIREFYEAGADKVVFWKRLNPP